MPDSHENNPFRDEIRPLAEAMVSVAPGAAALVVDARALIAANEAWRRITGCPDCSIGSLTLTECLSAFDDSPELAERLRDRSRSAGTISLRRTDQPAQHGESDGRTYSVKWRQFRAPGRDRFIALVMLDEPSEVERLNSVIELQRNEINHLLVRQTLIEENERRRLGRAMHDSIAQDLALMRAELMRRAPESALAERHIAALGVVIERVRSLAFELSPPILEDLGLVPALQWLAEHLGRRYGVSITLAPGATEPELSPPVRTIVFRAVRELAINAAKHATGARVEFSCAVTGRTAVIGVRDDGPGFEPMQLGRDRGGRLHFGLLSVEQQIRGVGGHFDVASGLGRGTRATITLPIGIEKEIAYG